MKLLVFCFTALCCINPAYSQSIIVDADLKEWNLEEFIQDNENQLSYLLKQDESNLYIAIKKSKHAPKVFSNGIEFSFDKQRPSDSSPKITFAFDYGFGKNPQFEKIKINNFTEIQDSIYYIPNEFGIEAFGIYSNLAKSEIGSNLSIDSELLFTMEMAIPLDYFKTIGDTLFYSIVLRGQDKTKDGTQFNKMAKMAEKANSIIDPNSFNYDLFNFSEHFGNFLIQK